MAATLVTTMPFMAARLTCPGAVCSGGSVESPLGRRVSDTLRGMAPLLPNYAFAMSWPVPTWVLLLPGASSSVASLFLVTSPPRLHAVTHAKSKVECCEPGPSFRVPIGTRRQRAIAGDDDPVLRARVREYDEDGAVLRERERVCAADA
eukprot:2205388-Rhodomonas_salina.1